MSRTVIAGARVFDGQDILGTVDIHVENGIVTAVGDAGHEGSEVVDAACATLLPGLIDSHSHTADDQSLRQAIHFGVTTELDLGALPELMVALRRRAARNTEMADVRSALIPLTPPGRHPHRLRKNLDDPDWPTATTAAAVPRFVSERVAEGADYIKAVVEDGHALNTPVPALPEELIKAAVVAAHEQDRIVIAHALALHAAVRAVNAGVDGLSHLFLDRPHTPELIAEIASRDIFVIPTMTALASIAGVPAGAELAAHERVHPHLTAPLLENLKGARNALPKKHFDYALASLAALREAGVDVLAGTDAANAEVPGTAHGASMHDELRLLVLAGFSTIEALRAATSLPAHRFGLDDRGRIAPGMRADLLLVDGDPVTSIGDTLTVRRVWREGVALSTRAGR
ncbi:amidohydrolase family protein [Pseudonocardia adelaidensis]